ncbi:MULTISPECIES: RNA polymerase sigma factor [unclassified Leifsonia]|uniref:RNA polymerase sigma factor n=1 Tax=unclassified Leifsonia TaxID=2663824 RepID=UPI000B29EE43|nr:MULTISPECIES: sigma-70 family RNA polymerase sigma factor [unclassified Leifsonia]
MTTAEQDAVASTGAVAAAISETHAAEWSRIVASLIRVTRDWSLAEDAAQDAFAKAIERWPVEGVPRNPGAWITTVARNGALDRIRRSANEALKMREVAMMDEIGRSDDSGTDIDDDRLRLIFTCCHPALAIEARVALTLRTVAGLTTPEIARAFLVPEATMAQRLVRAKRKIQNAGIPYRVPPAELLEERLAGVLAVLYLVFNAGYTLTDDAAHDEALSAEAIRVGSLLTELLPRSASAHGLLALMLLQHARRAGRSDGAGELVSLEEQDRTRWDALAIRRGLNALEASYRLEPVPDRYQALASIAACHATAATADATDYARIAALYAGLAAADASPVVALNAAIARGMADGPEAGLAAVDRVAASGALDGYYLVPAAQADFLRRLGRTDAAGERYDAAIALAPAGPERRYLQRRRAALGLPSRPTTSP